MGCPGSGPGPGRGFETGSCAAARGACDEDGVCLRCWLCSAGAGGPDAPHPRGSSQLRWGCGLASLV